MNKGNIKGLTTSEVNERISKNLVNYVDEPKTKTVKEIVKSNVFTYLDVFCKEDSFEKYLPEYKNLDELKDHYRRGGLGDMKIKRFLNDVLQEELRPIRERREELAKNPEYVFNILKEGTLKARKKASETVKEVKKAMMLDYFE